MHGDMQNTHGFPPPPAADNHRAANDELHDNDDNGLSSSDGEDEPFPTLPSTQALVAALESNAANEEEIGDNDDDSDMTTLSLRTL